MEPSREVVVMVTVMMTNCTVSADASGKTTRSSPNKVEAIVLRVMHRLEEAKGEIFYWNRR